MPKILINSQMVDANLKLKDKYQVILNSKDQIILKNDQQREYVFYKSDNEIYYNGQNYRFDKNVRNKVMVDDEHELVSPMPGKILKVFVEKNQKVKKGEVLLILEAMKMEHSIKAPIDGIVDEVFFNEGELVSSNVELIKLL